MKKFLITILLFNTYLLNAQTIWRAPAVFKEWASFNNNFTITHSTDTIGICYGLFGKNGMGFKSHNTTDTAFIGFTDVYGTKIPILISKKDSSFTQIGARSGGGFFVADSNAIINKSCAYFGSSDTIGYSVNGNRFILPFTDGSAGEVLTTDGAGNLNFSSITNSAWGLTGNTGAAGNWLGTNNNTSIYFKTNNTDKVIIDSNGRVGIGTISPTSAVEIYNTASNELWPLKINTAPETITTTKTLRGIFNDMDNYTVSPSASQLINAYGIYNTVKAGAHGSAAGNFAYGIYNNVSNVTNSSSYTYGIYNEITGDNSTMTYGIYSKLNGEYSGIAGYFVAPGGLGTRYALKAEALSVSGQTGTRYGVHASVSTHSNGGSACGVYASATGALNSTTTNNYGLYSYVTGGGKKYGAYITVDAGDWSSTNYGLIVMGSGLSGIGTATPSAQLHIKGTGATNATFSLKIENSAATSLLQVRDDGVSAFASLDSVTAYALTTPPAGGIVYCNNCTGNGITGRLLAYIASAWRRLTFE